MPQLHTPPEAVLPQLRRIEKRLLKALEQAVAYQAEIHKLEQAVVKVKSDQVEKTEEAWHIPHHIVHQWKEQQSKSWQDLHHGVMCLQQTTQQMTSHEDLLFQIWVMVAGGPIAQKS